MFIQPRDATPDESEGQPWIAEGHGFGRLSVNGLPGRPSSPPPTSPPTNGGLLIRPARPHPVRKAIEQNPDVIFTVIGDYAFVPGRRRAKRTCGRSSRTTTTGPSGSVPTSPTASPNADTASTWPPHAGSAATRTASASGNPAPSPTRTRQGTEPRP